MTKYVMFPDSYRSMVDADVRQITVRQPYASLLLPYRGHAPVKQIEWRTRRTAHRGPVLIVAGKKRPEIGSVVVDWFVSAWPDMSQPTLRRTVDPIGGVPLHFGAVVGVATLTDCVPVTTHHTIGDPECIVAHGDGTLDHVIPSWHAEQGPSAEHVADRSGYGLVRLDAVEIPDGAGLISDISDQDGYAGGYAVPGNWGYMLDGVVALADPVPCVGTLGVTRPDLGVVEAVSDQLGSRPISGWL